MYRILSQNENKKAESISFYGFFDDIHSNPDRIKQSSADYLRLLWVSLKAKQYNVLTLFAFSYLVHFNFTSTLAFRIFFAYICNTRRFLTNTYAKNLTRMIYPDS